MHVAGPEGRYKLFQYVAGGEQKKWFRLRPGVAVSGTPARPRMARTDRPAKPPNAGPNTVQIGPIVALNAFAFGELTGPGPA